MHTLIARDAKINNLSVVLIEPEDMGQAILNAFTAMNTDKRVFIPEIKVKRKNDTLFISELRKTKVSVLAMVEVGFEGDKAPIPLDLLDRKTLGAIWERMKK